MPETQKRSQWRWLTTAAPLARAALVIAVTVWFMTRPGAVPANSAANTALSQEQKIRKTGRDLIRIREWARACTLMKAYLAKYPDDPEAWTILAKAQMRGGDNTQAEHSVDVAVQLAPLRAETRWIKGELTPAGRPDVHGVVPHRRGKERGRDAGLLVAIRPGIAGGGAGRGGPHVAA